MKRIAAGLAGGLILMFLAGTGTVSAANSTAVSGQDRAGSITINYYDDADGKTGISGAEFRAVRIGEVQEDPDLFPFRSLVPSVTIDETTKASDIAGQVKGYMEAGESVTSYEMRTDKSGRALVSSAAPGVYYLEETGEAEYHRPSEPVLLTVPYMEEDGSAWNYDVLVAPKPVRTGDLRITKTVGGNAGDRKKRFQFHIDLGEEGKFPYTTSDGRSGSVSSGETIELADGESILISDLLEGSSYSVSEVRADMDGYATEAKNSAGRIAYGKAADCRFTNTKNASPAGSGGGSSAGGKAGSVRTGDDTDVMLPTVLLFASGGILAVLGLVCGRKRRQRRV